MYFIGPEQRTRGVIASTNEIRAEKEGMEKGGEPHSESGGIQFRFSDQARAAAPEMISVSSVVIWAWRARL